MIINSACVDKYFGNCLAVGKTCVYLGVSGKAKTKLATENK